MLASKTSISSDRSLRGGSGEICGITDHTKSVQELLWGQFLSQIQRTGVEPRTACSSDCSVFALCLVREELKAALRHVRLRMRECVSCHEAS